MILNRTHINIDHSGRELPEKGMQLFYLYANEGNIHEYVAGCIPSHWHNALEIFVLLRGRVQIGINDQIYILTSGEGCFINSNVLHSFTAMTNEPCLYRSFVFDSSIVSGTPGSIFDTKYVRPLMEKGPAFIRFTDTDDNKEYFSNFDKTFDLCVNEPYGYEFETRDYLSKIVLFIKDKARLEQLSKIPERQDLRIKQMLAWIEKNIDKAITVSEIAESVNICVRECQRIFNKYMHYSPMEYVRRKRIFMAADKIVGTDTPITDIAIECGFSSHSHFTRQFRELVGETPTAYRASHAPKL